MKSIMAFFSRAAVLLAIIFFFALFLRTYLLGSVPSSFHLDEVANTYVGRFILQNGVDLYGNKFPLLYFDKHGDYPPVIPMYISALGTFLFGLNIFGSRIAIAIIGSLVVFPVFFISKLIFKNKGTALFSALAIAILPWHVAFSRMNTEGTIAVTVYTTGLAFLLYSLKKTSWKLLLASAAFLFSTYLLYPSFRIIVPLTFLPLSLFYLYERFYKKQKIGHFKGRIIALTLIAFALTGYIATTPWGQGRYKETSLFTDSRYILEQNLYIAHEKSPLDIKLFENKGIIYGHAFLNEYLSYFSPQFLFGSAGLPDWFKIPMVGLFYYSFLILLFIFLVAFGLRKKSTIHAGYFSFILALCALAPIPAALTSEYTPNMHRSLLLSVLLVLIFSAGFHAISYFKYKKILCAFVIFIFTVESFLFVRTYFVHENWTSVAARGDGRVQLAQYLIQHQKEYNTVFVYDTGWFPVYYLYFSHNFSKNVVGKVSQPFIISSLDNVRFMNGGCGSESAGDKKEWFGKKNLILVSNNCNLITNETIKYLGGIKLSAGYNIYSAYETK